MTFWDSLLLLLLGETGSIMLWFFDVSGSFMFSFCDV